MSSRTESSPSPRPATAERALPVGTRLDDCEIEQVLAQGSLAVVYRAYDHALRLQVAIKEYMPDALALRSGPTQVVLRTRLGAQRFERGLRAFIGEAQTLARFEHPSLLRVDRILQRNGTAYRVMRHSPGPTLLEHRRALARPPDAATLRTWFDALLGALEVLHGEGWMHGSVTPGNILLLQDGRPLLMDFGAVRAAVLDNGTQDMLAALEPSFEPVEQRDATAGLTQGPWTDLYSLAATLRFCVSGKLPSAPGAAAAAPDAEPTTNDWTGLRGDPSAPAGSLVAALEACLAEAPQDRPQSVAQVRALLGHPVVAALGSEPASPGAGVQATPPVAIDTAPAEPTPAPDGAEDATADSAADAARAQVLADLEETFARLDAQAGQVARPGVAPPPAPLGAAAAMAKPAQPQPQPQPQLQWGSEPASRRRRWPAGVALAVLVGLLAGAWLLRSGPEPGGAGRPAESPIAVAPAPVAPAPSPLAAATVVEPAPPATPARPTAPSATPPARPATDSRANPAAARGTSPSTSTSPRAAAVAAPAPRAQCGGRSGYALYQCMQTQCAKRSFVKHPECQRLRKEQRLP